MSIGADPLPQHYLTDDEPGIGGRLKERPEDFIVEETPLYEPCGAGEHLYLFIEKRGRPTLDVVRDLARAFHLSTDAVGYAGMKDKQAITRQLVSLHTADESPLERLDLRGVKVLWSDRHTNKLRLGHLRSNRFAIRMRGVEPSEAPRVKRILDRLERHGAPNYIGEQRFGFYLNNHEIGRRFLQQDWEGMTRLMLGNADEHDGPDAASRRLFDEGDFQAAADRLPTSRPNERRVAVQLAKGRSHEEAVMSMSRPALLFFISAFQSGIFNRVLTHRLEQIGIDQLIDGDLAWKHDSRAVFAVGQAELEGDVLARRLAGFEVSPSGPMWGYDMIRPRGAVGDIEMATLLETEVEPEAFVTPPHHVKGARRPLRMPITDSSVEAGADEFGPYILVRFTLPRGSFATTVLREIMKTPPRSRPWGAD
ncbi:MAG: tRNA pseudouridine(13) synthase TruD [Phycisphaerales bacterium]